MRGSKDLHTPLRRLALILSIVEFGIFIDPAFQDGNNVGVRQRSARSLEDLDTDMLCRLTSGQGRQ